ncbi:MAG: hypothetical protein R3268_05695 [Acidiferrobacterales bacterium]|nr:hypothetical protein [Acidiferrobacterales bacterium]
MPIVERDPWRVQYFEGVSCPEDIEIPTEDADAYLLYPRYRWIYNKLLICETQGIEHGPHGVNPRHFPVFSKPIYNMRGMGSGSKVIESAEDYQREHAPGHMWMPLLAGEHVSTDVAVIDGQSRWWRHVTGKALGKGLFDYWTVLAESRPELEQYCADWLQRNLKGYTGMINFETIGGKIIECHLRFADQWVDLYGPGWVGSLVELYAHHRWTFADDDRRAGYSVVLFGGHGLRYRKVDRSIVDELLQQPGISSIQITFHENKAPKMHAMPPGGFRLAIVNCWDLEAGFAARERLAVEFWSTQKLHVRKARSSKSVAKA